MTRGFRDGDLHVNTPPPRPQQQQQPQQLPDEVSARTLLDKLNNQVDNMRANMRTLETSMLTEFRQLSEYVTAKLDEGTTEPLLDDDPRDTAIRALETARMDIISKTLAPAATVVVDLLKHTEDGLQQDLSQLTAEQAQQQTRDMYEYFEQQLQDLLRVLGFADVKAKPGDAFDRKLHKTVRRVETSDASLNDTIHCVLAPGFGHPGAQNTAIPAQVAVYRYVASASESPQTDK